MEPTSLDAAIETSLLVLLEAFRLEPTGPDRFRATNDRSRFPRLFGGQVLGQALLAAAATVGDKAPHSLHAYFAEAGDAGTAIDIAVGRVRDGRSIDTRQVTVRQGDRVILAVLASFHVNPAEPEVGLAAPDVPPPEALPRLQEWVGVRPAPDAARSRLWIDVPPPLDLRIDEPPSFLGGDRAPGPRSHWMRLPRSIGDDPTLHAAVLVYSSDYLLLDMVFRAHPGDGPLANAASLDHAIWLHRPVRMDEWHVYTQETIGVVGHRGLVQGTIHDRAGRLVATVMQECIAR